MLSSFQLFMNNAKNMNYSNDSQNQQNDGQLLTQIEAELNLNLLISDQSPLKHSIDLEEISTQFIQKIKEQIPKVIIIQSYLKMRIQKRKFHIMIKWAKYRKNVLLELIETEKIYVSDLERIIIQVNLPLKYIISEQDHNLLFRNLVQICQFNKQFLSEIQEKFENYSHFTCFGKIFDKFVKFFKIYFEYTQNFSLDIVNQLRKKNKEMDQLLIDLDNKNLFKGLSLESYLIKPVQRLPKYVLLIKELLKHTWNQHPDYNDIRESLNKFIEVNKQIDIQMDNVIKNQMLFDLQFQYFDSINVSIVESTRKYIECETLNVLVSKQIKSVTLYICNDLLILTQREQNFLKTNQKLDSYLFLNENSYCKDNNGQKFWKQAFTVCSQNQSITFVCYDQDQKNKLLELIESLILEQQKKNNDSSNSLGNGSFLKISVFTKGTEQKKNFLSTYTVYNLLVTSGKTHQFISTRYSNMVKLQELIQKEFPGIKLPHLSKRQNVTHKTKELIEARKIILENFIESILNSPEIQSNPEKVLHFLDIPINFFDILSPLKQQKKSNQLWGSFTLDSDEEFKGRSQFQFKSFTVVHQNNQNN